MAVNQAITPQADISGTSAIHWYSSIVRSLHHHSLMVGSVIAGVVVLLVILAPVLTRADPDLQHASNVFLPPSLSHPFGTDQYGREMVARVLYGGRYTIGASIAVVLLGGTAGSILGLVAGYSGGAVNFLIMRFVDFLLAFPPLVLALAIAAILGPNFRNAIFAVALVAVPLYARIVEGAAVEVRTQPYVDAARSLGSGHAHIILRHILPGALPAIIVQTTAYLGIAALFVASLGFLGLGVQPPTPEWGELLAEGQSGMTLAWWVMVFPGGMLALYIIAVNLVGDGLRDVLDPTVARATRA